MRHFYRDSLPVNALFALTFVTVRGLEQAFLVSDMSSMMLGREGGLTGGMPWSDKATGGVVACWALLQLLNAVWICRILRMVIRMLAGGHKKAA